MRKIVSIGLGLIIVMTALATAPAQPARAASFLVNSTADAVDAAPGNGACETATPGQCTLRAAIQEANALAGDDSIVLPAGIFTLSIPGAGEDASAAGDLDITSNISISGSSASTTTIDGGSIDRIFHIIGSVTVTISNLTITNGNAGASANGGGILHAGGTLTLNNAEVSVNSAASGAGIFMSSGTASINSTWVTSNTAVTLSGGGVHVASGAVAVINNSTLSSNQASDGTNGAGGGIYVASGGTATLNNSTVSGNFADGSNVTAGGGGVYAAGTVNLNSVTVADNQATISGIGNGVLQLGGAVNLRNTIVADNGVDPNADPQCAGTMTSLGYNLVEIMDGCSGVANGANGDIVVASITGGTFALGALGVNGGPTLTHALLPSTDPSPNSALAVDAGNPAGCTDGSSTFVNDQRGSGFLRHSGTPARCDIGAFELDANVATATSTNTPTATNTPTNTLTPSITTTRSATPTNSNTPTPSNTPILSATPSPSATATPAPKIPLFTPAPITPTVDRTRTAAAQVTRTSAAATALAIPPTATANIALTQTTIALANASPTPTITETPTPTLSPTFGFPSEAGALSISQSVGRAGGKFTCGIWVFEAPKDAIPEGSAIHCKTVDEESAPELPGNLQAFWQIVDISVTASSGQPITSFTQPLLICAQYSDNYLAQVDDDPARFVIYTAGEGEAWRALNTTADADAPRVCAAPDHLSLFRLAAKPSSGAAAPTSSPWTIVGVVAVACGALLFIVVLVVVIAILRARKPQETDKGLAKA